MQSINGEHGLATNNRKFYWNPIENFLSQSIMIQILILINTFQKVKLDILSVKISIVHLKI